MPGSAFALGARHSALELSGAGATGATATGATTNTQGAATGSVTAATTCAPAVLQAAQASVGAALSGVLDQLNALNGEVGGSATLSPGNKSALSTDLANELAGIRALQAKVPDDVTCAQVAQDGRNMVLDYRVYVVMTPQVHLTISADTETSLAGTLAGLEPNIQAAITAAGAQGKNVAAAQQAFADMETQVTSAQQDSAGISATVLAFTPASYPACWSTFVSERVSLQKGAQALRTADQDLHTVLADLG